MHVGVLWVHVLLRGGCCGGRRRVVLLLDVRGVVHAEGGGAGVGGRGVGRVEIARQRHRGSSISFEGPVVVSL